MNYAEIKYCDIANGPGVRTSLFVSGCNHHCKNCFNEIAWDFSYGNPFTQETINEILLSLSPSYVHGITLLGGEPLEHSNQQGLLPLLRQIHEKYPEKNVWCFTGFTFETDVLDKMCNVWPETTELLSYVDVLVDGKFVEELKDISLRFRGSSNQRIIDVPASLEAGKTILWDDGQSGLHH